VMNRKKTNPIRTWTILLEMNNTDCQRIKCEDYLADGGEPAWCLKAGCPAIVAVTKCPKLQGKENGRSDDVKRRNR
jgi:hypothetical protein